MFPSGVDVCYSYCLILQEIDTNDVIFFCTIGRDKKVCDKTRICDKVHLLHNLNINK